MVIVALIEAGADVNARDINNKIPFDYAKKKAALKQTKAYWLLHEARFK